MKGYKHIQFHGGHFLIAPEFVWSHDPAFSELHHEVFDHPSAHRR